MESAEKTQAITEAREEFLRSLHVPILKLIVFLAGPVVIIAYFMFALVNPAWQMKVVAGAAWLMVGAWIPALRLAQKDKLELSALIFVFSIILYDTIGLVLEGTLPTALMANLGITIYGMFFSRRVVACGIIGTMAHFTLAEVLIFTHPFTPYLVTGTERLVINLLFGALLLPLIAYFLLRSYALNKDLVDRIEHEYAKQSTIIDTANRLQDHVDQAVARIRELSGQFSSQATHQAGAAAQVNSTVLGVNEMLNATRDLVVESQQIVEKSHLDSLQGSRQLRRVEKGFDDVVASVGAARSEVEDLSRQASRIQEVLALNTEIGRQIKILGINAAVQAAKAGEHAKGFNVIAAELRELIQRTDENLRQSRKLLDGIREGTGRCALRIQNGTDVLNQQVTGLKMVVSLVEQNAKTFADTSETVARISKAAGAQESEMDSVALAMNQIDVAASQLVQSSVELLASMEEVIRSQRALRAVLSS